MITMKLYGFFSAQDVYQFQASHSNNSLDLIEIARSLLLHGSERAVVPVSQFKVGAIAIDDQHNFYVGMNQECSHAAIGQTVHAEQSAIANAWVRGAQKITDIVVTHTPCGHCRQFLNELRGAEQLKIHVYPESGRYLHEYLPNSFGPANLNAPIRFLDEIYHGYGLPENALYSDPLYAKTLKQFNRSYAPYSQAYAAVGLRVKTGEVFAGAYAENAAYNPSLPPLQVALNALRLDNFHENDVCEAILLHTEHGGHIAHTQALWTAISDVPLKTILMKI